MCMCIKVLQSHYLSIRYLQRQEGVSLFLDIYHDHFKANVPVWFELVETLTKDQLRQAVECDTFHHYIDKTPFSSSAFDAYNIFLNVSENCILFTTYMYIHVQSTVVCLQGYAYAKFSSFRWLGFGRIWTGQTEIWLLLISALLFRSEKYIIVTYNSHIYTCIYALTYCKVYQWYIGTPL